MPRRNWTDEDEALLLNLRNDGYTYAEISEIMDRSESSVSNKFLIMSKKDDSTQEEENDSEDPEVLSSNQERFEHKEDNDSVQIRSVSERIQTVDEALEHASVNTTVWKVDRFVVNSWEAPSKEHGVTTLWQVKVWLIRIASNPMT